MTTAGTDAFRLYMLAQEDAGDVAALEAATFSTPWTREQYEKILPVRRVVFEGGEAGACGSLQDTATPVFGLRTQEGELIAYLCVGVQLGLHEMEVYNIAVHTAYRRHGLASRLLASVLPLAYDAGIEQVFLEVREHNAPAIALYRRFGFEECGRRKAYYADSGEDALVMMCRLEAGVVRAYPEKMDAGAS